MIQPKSAANNDYDSHDNSKRKSISYPKKAGGEGVQLFVHVMSSETWRTLKECIHTEELAVELPSGVAVAGSVGWKQVVRTCCGAVSKAIRPLRSLGLPGSSY
jgi:hypothetical protein